MQEGGVGKPTAVASFKTGPFSTISGPPAKPDVGDGEYNCNNSNDNNINNNNNKAGGSRGGGLTPPPPPQPTSAANNATNSNNNNNISSVVDPQLLYRNLWLFVWLKTIGSYDSGAFSAALGTTNGIADDWGLSAAQQGTLTSSVFLGNVIGCPLAGHLFSAFSEKHVLNASLAVHGVFTFLFATFPNYYAALFCRFFIGLSLAFIVVYTPVWVDEFAPKDRQSIWMASHNAGVPVGIMMGYILATFFPAYLSLGWEWSFYIKCVLMVPTMAYIAKVDTRSINTRKKKKSSSSGNSTNRAADAMRTGSEVFDAADGELLSAEAPLSPSSAVPPPGAVGVCVWLRLSLRAAKRKARVLWGSLWPLLTNAVFMCSVLAMCSLYFVATGLQNFVTQYLRGEPFNASARTVMAGFGAAVVTAPVCGVIVGGILLDRLGGYQGNLLRVAVFAMAWGGAAALFSVICIFVTTTSMFLIVMSVVLFCGGAIIPPGAGLTMAALPPHLRSVGAALSQTLYNLLGNFSGPLVCGLVAEWTGELKYGIMTLLISSAAGLVPMAGILFVALRGGGGPAALGGRANNSNSNNNARLPPPSDSQVAAVMLEGDDSEMYRLNTKKGGGGVDDYDNNNNSDFVGKQEADAQFFSSARPLPGGGGGFATADSLRGRHARRAADAYEGEENEMLPTTGNIISNNMARADVRISPGGVYGRPPAARVQPQTGTDINNNNANSGFYSNQSMIKYRDVAEREEIAINGTGNAASNISSLQNSLNTGYNTTNNTNSRINRYSNEESNSLRMEEGFNSSVVRPGRQEGSGSGAGTTPQAHANVGSSVSQGRQGAAAAVVRGPGAAVASAATAATTTTIAAAAGGAGGGNNNNNNNNLGSGSYVNNSNSSGNYVGVNNSNNSNVNSRTRRGGATATTQQQPSGSAAASESSFSLANDLDLTQNLSIPNQHMFGVDFVRSWLLAQPNSGHHTGHQQQQQQHASANAAASGGVGGNNGNNNNGGAGGGVAGLRRQNSHQRSEEGGEQ